MTVYATERIHFPTNSKPIQQGNFMKGCDHGDGNLEEGKKKEMGKEVYRLGEKTLPDQFCNADLSACSVYRLYDHDLMSVKPRSIYSRLNISSYLKPIYHWYLGKREKKIKKESGWKVPMVVHILSDVEKQM